jgi:hypothetical protein
MTATLIVTIGGVTVALVAAVAETRKARGDTYVENRLTKLECWRETVESKDL